MELKPKEEMFVQSYLKHKFNGTQAYLEINPNVKVTSARVNASRLLANISIRLKISEELSKQGLGIENLITRLKKLTEAFKFVNPAVGYGVDNKTRLDTIKFLCQLHGLNAGKNEIFIMPEQLEQLAEEERPKIEEEI